MKDSRINILFLITFSTFFGNFNDINWFYWLQYIATLLDQELLDYLQQIIQGIPITILFMPSLVTFNGLFCNMSLVIYHFGLPALWLKASTPLTYFFLYILLILITQRCACRIEIHFHLLTWMKSNDIFQLFLGFMNFNKQFLK